MESTNFIRLNVNDSYLSFGNFIRIIKEESSSSSSFMQSDLFSIIFDTYDIADSTVNNYCTGFRAINAKYKTYFSEIKKQYEYDKQVLLPVISKIVALLDEINNSRSTKITIQNINTNARLKNVCNRLYSISKNDSDVNAKLSNELYKNIKSSNLYDFISQVLFYVILDKNQPVFIDKKLNEIIEKSIYDTNISVNDIQDFIKIHLNSGIWSIRGIKQLANKKNPFACFEIASMECYGIATGKVRYDKAYDYYKIAAEYNHPVANWAIGYLYYEGYIGSKSKRDLFLAFKYFNKARKLKCSNAYNSLGLILLNGTIPHIKPNKQKAITMFEEAISLGNIYAYNNLGKIYESSKNYKKAFENYLISASNGESWAANKVGEYYMKNGEFQKAFDYYNISSEAPKFTLCPWSKYNLAKYFYKHGCLEIGISKDINKCIQLLDDISDVLLEACIELIYIYYELYLKYNKKEHLYLDKLNYYREKCENHPKYTKKLKSDIEKQLNLLNKRTIGGIIVPKK